MHQVAKVLQLQHQSSNEYSGLISFRIDWFDLLAAQGTLKSLLQCHSLKASIYIRVPEKENLQFYGDSEQERHTLNVY